MLYVDSSVLVKLYFKEAGSDSTILRVKTGSRTVITSVLSFAEVHAAMARKRRERQITYSALLRLREEFQRDWINFIEVLDIDALTLAALPTLVERFPLKAGDAIQLSTALWLKETLDIGMGAPEAKILQFAAADRNLAGIAQKCGLDVFNPERQ